MNLPGAEKMYSLEGIKWQYFRKDYKTSAV